MTILILIIGTILLAIFHSPLWLIVTILLGFFQIQFYRYYAGNPWRKVFFRIRKIYDVHHAQVTAKDARYVRTPSQDLFLWLEFLKRFYNVIYPELSNYEIDQRFEHIIQSVANFTDRDAIRNIFKRKFPESKESKIDRLMNVFEEDLKHTDNQLAILKIAVMADIIGRETDNQNRLEFLYTAITSPKTLGI